MRRLKFNLLTTTTTIKIQALSSLRLQHVQLSQRDRAAGCVIVFAKSRRLELGDNILRTV